MNQINVQGYLKTTKMPWSQLFYRLVWRHLEHHGKRILDFGSGLGITASHLAADNEVVAVEPNEEMIRHRIRDHEYTQITGSIDALKNLPGQSFDVIVCHNVLEYMEERKALLTEFVRLLRPDGCVSVVKHHKWGKIMQKVVFENNIGDALRLLEDGAAASVNFGVIHEYEEDALEQYAGGHLRIDRVYGLRMFYALQRNEWKQEPDWLERLFQMESAAEEIPAFREIAFFHHIILRPAAQGQE